MLGYTQHKIETGTLKGKLSMDNHVLPGTLQRGSRSQPREERCHEEPSNLALLAPKRHLAGDRSFLREADKPSVSDREFLVRNRFLSADPAMRGWIADNSTSWPRMEAGDTMRAFAVGEVVESLNRGYAVSDKVMGIFGWQDYAAVKQPQVMRKVLENDLPLSLSLGVLGPLERRTATGAASPRQACDHAGLLTIDFAERYEEAVAALAGWISNTEKMPYKAPRRHLHRSRCSMPARTTAS
jgi:N-terminal domain of oxidoreductase